MSISIKLFFDPSQDMSFNKDSNNGSRGSAPPRLESISLDFGDIDFSNSGSPLAAAKGGKPSGSPRDLGLNNFLEAGDIDFQPGNGSKNFAPQLGQRKSTGKPDDNFDDFTKDFSEFIQQLMSACSKFFGGAKPSDDNPIEKSNGVSPSQHRSPGGGNDFNTNSPPPSKRPSVSDDDNPSVNGSSKPAPKTNSSDVNNNSDTETKSTKAVTPTKMPDPTGTVTVNETIVVKAGETFDGGGKHYKAGAALGDGGKSEGQKPLFILEDGAKLKNVQISGADGVHTNGDATLEDVWWRDVGEDALSMKKDGNVTVTGGGAYDAADKIFTVTASGKLSIEGFTAENFGRLVATDHRFNPDRNDGTYSLDVSIKNSNLTNGVEAFLTDATGSRVTFDNVDLNNVSYDARGPKGLEVIGGKKVGVFEGRAV